MYHVLLQILCIYSLLCLEKSYLLFSLIPLGSLRFSLDISSRKSFQIPQSVSNIYLYWYPFWIYNIYSETHLIQIYSKQTIIVKALGCFNEPSKGMQVSLKSYNEGLKCHQDFSPLSPCPVSWVLPLYLFSSPWILSIFLCVCLLHFSSSLCRLTFLLLV